MPADFGVARVGNGGDADDGVDVASIESRKKRDDTVPGSGYAPRSGDPMADDREDLALAPVFRELRDRWLEARPEAAGEDLATRLGVTRTRASGWTSGERGSDPGHPTPLWAVRALAKDLGTSIVITGDTVSIVSTSTPAPVSR